MEIIELIINEENGDGVFAISLVDKPAIEQDFMHYINLLGTRIGPAINL